MSAAFWFALALSLGLGNKVWNIDQVTDLIPQDFASDFFYPFLGNAAELKRAKANPDKTVYRQAEAI